MIKCRYVATVTLDFHIDDQENGVRPFAEIKDNGGRLMSEALRCLFTDEVDDIDSVNIEQQSWDVTQCADE